jgi:hypothetical protein
MLTSSGTECMTWIPAYRLSRRVQSAKRIGKTRIVCRVRFGREGSGLRAAKRHLHSRICAALSGTFGRWPPDGIERYRDATARTPRGIDVSGVLRPIVGAAWPFALSTWACERLYEGRQTR